MTDLERLQGSWEGGGPGGPCTVDISGNSLSFGQPPPEPGEQKFWYETTFTIPEVEGPKQLHATIIDNVFQDDIGTVVVTIYKIEGETLTLGVVEDFDEPPTEPVVGDWDWVMDIYELERAKPASS